MTRRCIITGGAGFIGSYLARKLARDGWQVVAVDNFSRSDAGRLANDGSDIELIDADIRHPSALTPIFAGAEAVFHLAAINGTDNFYSHPEQVLDVGIRGMLAVVEACQTADVPDLVVASSAEVYQTPPSIPTDETVPLMLPDSLNPRYS